MADYAKTPAIRFAGFTDAWEQRKLKDICSVFTDGDWIESKDQSDQGVRLIQTGNVGVTEYLDKPNNKKWVSEDTFERLHCTEVLSGDILISRLPEPAGRACIVPKIGQKMITAVDCTIARIAPEYSSEYVVQYLSTQDYFDEVNNCLAGGTRQRISRGNLSSFLIPLPCSKAEQERIGGFFRSLDDLITLHQHEPLFLVMLFSGGSCVFKSAWEQRKLKDICSVFTDGDWIESKDQSDQGVRLIQTGNVGVTEYLDKPNNKKWVSEDTFERLHCTEVLSGDILISRLPEPAGRACIVPKIGQKMITAVDCTIARIAPEYSSEYVVQYLSTQDYFDEVNNCLAGGTRQRISRGNLSSFLIPLPCSKAEQERIGGFFRSLDDLITLHQRELEKLRNIKQSCLEKMFV